MKRKLRLPKNKYDIITIVSVIIGIIIFIMNFFFVKSNFIYLFSIAFVLIGPIIVEYIKYKENKGIEENFPNFLRDISENIKAGMTLPQAIRATKDSDYSTLSPHVRRMATQIDWGIPFDEILENFASNGTSVIKRTVSTIIETHKSGGKIAESLSAVGRGIMEINKIQKERFSSVYSQLITGYIVFFVFLGVIIALRSFLLPSLFTISSPELGIFATGEELVGTYSEIFQWLIIIQGFFSGLVIGKMAHGNVLGGLKHSLALIIIGYGALLIF